MTDAQARLLTQLKKGFPMCLNTMQQNSQKTKYQEKSTWLRVNFVITYDSCVCQTALLKILLKRCTETVLLFQ
jgi:hypothetical protein